MTCLTSHLQAHTTLMYATTLLYARQRDEGTVRGDGRSAEERKIEGREDKCSIKRTDRLFNVSLVGCCPCRVNYKKTSVDSR